MIKRLAFMICLGLALAWPALAGQQGFVLKDLQGREHTLAGYGGKWVVVNYWATWCPPCLEEIPDLIALHDQHQDLVVIGVSIDHKSRKEVEDFVDDNLMSYPVVLGNDAVTRQIGPADVLPTTYIYNPQGKLVKIHRGLITRQYIEKLVARN